LLEKLVDAREIYEFVYSKSLMLANGIDFASDIFQSKAFETVNELWNEHPCFEIAVLYCDIEGALRECAEDLSVIHQ
jgi:hypothetical protein